MSENELTEIMVVVKEQENNSSAHNETVLYTNSYKFNGATTMREIYNLVSKDSNRQIIKIDIENEEEVIGKYIDGETKVKDIVEKGCKKVIFYVSQNEQSHKRVHEEDYPLIKIQKKRGTYTVINCNDIINDSYRDGEATAVLQSSSNLLSPPLDTLPTPHSDEMTSASTDGTNTAIEEEEEEENIENADFTVEDQLSTQFERVNMNTERVIPAPIPQNEMPNTNENDDNERNDEDGNNNIGSSDNGGLFEIDSKEQSSDYPYDRISLTAEDKNNNYITNDGMITNSNRDNGSR